MQGHSKEQIMGMNFTSVYTKGVQVDCWCCNRLEDEGGELASGQV